MTNLEKEKRKERRFVERGDVLIKDERFVQEDAPNGMVYGFTRDISLSGTRIICDQVFPVGSFWRMLIRLERTNEFLRLDGRVVWIKKSKNARCYHIGVEFHHRYPDTIRRLIKHLYSQGEVPAPVS